MKLPKTSLAILLSPLVFLLKMNFKLFSFPIFDFYCTR